jgi:protease IV
MTERPQRKLPFGCLFILIVSLCFFGSLILISVLLGGQTRGMESIHEVHVSGPQEGKALALIDVGGVMTRGGGVSDEGITTPLLKMLKRAGEDDDVQGVLLRLNTPGGSVTDADLIYHQIKALQKRGKRVLLLMDDTCASGGYYVALAADEVWALPTTITGSIGVLISALNFSDMMSRYGVTDVSITSGANKSLLSPTQPLNAAHQAILKGIVQELYERFVRLLKEGRKLEDEVARGLADGRVFTAQQALEAKLIDKIGYPDEAHQRLIELTGLGPKARLIHYRIPRSFLSQLTARLMTPTLQERTLDLAMTPNKAYYLYAPQGPALMMLKGVLRR